MFEAVAFRIVIRPDAVEKKTKSGLYLAVDEAKEKGACVTGTIVDIGPDVFKAHKTVLPFAGLKVGDKVYFAKYAGKWVVDLDTEEEFLVINDEDVCCKIIETKT